MLIAEDTHRGKFYIHAYTPGEIRVNNEKFDRSILLTSDQLINPWAPQTFSELLPDGIQHGLFKHILIDRSSRACAIGTTRP